MCATVHYNLLTNFKKWYTPYRKNEGKTIFWLNTVILTEIRVKQINDVALLARSSIKLRVGAIRLGNVYVCYYTHKFFLMKYFSAL